MKIVYVAKHNSGGNDDEGAIAYALRLLGHEVQCVHENTVNVDKLHGDFLLCHHWHNLACLSMVKLPKVYWCFDLIDWPEPKIRHEQRVKWATAMAEICDLGFHTDGDWVAKDRTGKLRWLTQGADEREIAEWSIPGFTRADVLFVGGLGYGREKFVADMRRCYGTKFRHINGYHGSALLHAIKQAKIVVAPPSPVTDRYWSNRVYNVLRMGGFLLHPYVDGLRRQYRTQDLFLYRSAEDMHELIKDYLQFDQSRKLMGASGMEWTMLLHTYRHRCIELLTAVKEVLHD